MRRRPVTDTASAVHAVTPPVSDTGSAAPASSGRRVSWDVIRVLALIEIVLFHDTYLGPTTEPGIPELPHAWTHTCGASILIMVSGYFAAVTLRRNPPGRWLARRFARLLPAYLVAVVVVFAVVKLLSPAEFSLHQLRWTDLVGNLFLMQQLLPNVAYIDLSWWTLPVQVAGFTAMALLASRRVGGRAVMPILWAVVLVPVVIREIWMGDHPSVWLVVALEGSGLCMAHLLVAGVAVQRWASRRLGTVHLALLLAAVLVAEKVHPPVTSVALVGVGLALMCLAARGPDWPLPAVFVTPVRWIAARSYGIYLMHQSIGYLLEDRLARLGCPSWIWVTGAVLAAGLLGWGLTAWVERPAYNTLLRVITRSRTLAPG
ncbi:acyltransferase family protein [Nocardia jiangxiensis]|uniref:acyltransferase family protein n=1 Tax=Nocardia jiangxiensis TaxID=282685 RepID=UPI0006868365|nr:acyltransferase [Nocardia jiangxiensis]